MFPSIQALSCHDGTLGETLHDVEQAIAHQEQPIYGLLVHHLRQGSWKGETVVVNSNCRAHTRITFQNSQTMAYKSGSVVFSSSVFPSFEHLTGLFTFYHCSSFFTANTKNGTDLLFRNVRPFCTFHRTIVWCNSGNL